MTGEILVLIVEQTSSQIGVLIELCVGDVPEYLDTDFFPVRSDLELFTELSSSTW